MIVMVIVIVIREIHDSWHVMIVIIPKEVRLRASRAVPVARGIAQPQVLTSRDHDCGQRTPMRNMQSTITINLDTTRPYALKSSHTSLDGLKFYTHLTRGPDIHTRLRSNEIKRPEVAAARYASAGRVASCWRP